MLGYGYGLDFFNPWCTCTLSMDSRLPAPWPITRVMCQSLSSNSWNWVYYFTQFRGFSAFYTDFQHVLSQPYHHWSITSLQVVLGTTVQEEGGVVYISMSTQSFCEVIRCADSPKCSLSNVPKTAEKVCGVFEHLKVSVASTRRRGLEDFCEDSVILWASYMC